MCVAPRFLVAPLSMPMWEVMVSYVVCLPSGRTSCFLHVSHDGCIFCVLYVVCLASWVVFYVLGLLEELMPTCKIWLFLYQSVHWGFGVGDLGFWRFGVGREVDLVVGGLGLRGQGWIGLAQRAGKYPVVHAFSRD